jgi:hypothetical protein
MHVIFWLFLYFKTIFQKQSMSVKTLCLSSLFVQSNYFNQITSYVIGQKFLVWPFQMIVLYIVQIQHVYR